jgi:hypothetical protein
VFLGFANFYRWFIEGYSRVARPLSDLLKDATKVFQMTDGVQAAFEQLKDAFTSAPMLKHFDPSRRIRLETDTSGFAIAGILSQLYGEGSDTRWYPIAFYLRKLQGPEIRYETHDLELMAIVMSFK